MFHAKILTSTIVFLLMLAAQAGEGLFCAQPKWNFGTRERAATFRHTLGLKNTSSRELKIVKIQKSCSSCLAVSRLESEIQKIV